VINNAGVADIGRFLRGQRLDRKSGHKIIHPGDCTMWVNRN